MRTCIDRLIALPRIDSPSVRNESEFILGRLEQCRQEGSISNDAFLDAGVIQGGLDMIANHIDMGVPQSEIQELLRGQLSRAERLNQKHPNLDKAVEAGR